MTKNTRRVIRKARKLMVEAVDLHMRSGGHDLQVHLALEAEDALLDYIQSELEALEFGGVR